MEDNKPLGITPGTIVRTILLAVALINQILTFLGKPLIYIDNAQLSELVALVFSIATTVIAWWKNNSFTEAARAGDAVMHGIRNGYDVEVSITNPDDEEDESDE